MRSVDVLIRIGKHEKHAWSSSFAGRFKIEAVCADQIAQVSTKQVATLTCFWRGIGNNLIWIEYHEDRTINRSGPTHD